MTFARQAREVASAAEVADVAKKRDEDDDRKDVLLRMPLDVHEDLAALAKREGGNLTGLLNRLGRAITRLPPDLRRELEKIAEAECRSTADQVAVILEAWLRERKASK